MQLSYGQMKHFYEKGFVQIQGVIPKVMIQEALKSINCTMGEGSKSEDMSALSRSPEIRDLLLKTPAWDYLESALEPGKVKPVNSGQIALRFPTKQDPPSRPIGHLDGMHTPTNGVPEGTIGNFTMLVVILLSDLDQENAGNFTVWPGTHHIFEEYFQQHGPQKLLEHVPETLLETIPYDIPEPHQFIGKAGDVILCHYMTAHTAAPNVSYSTRYATIYRITHVDNDSPEKESMKDIWLHWPGIRSKQFDKE